MRSPALFRILAASVFLVFLLLINWFLTFTNTRQLRTDALWVQHTYQVSAELEKTLAAVTNAETDTRGYIITGDEEFLEPYVSATTEIDQHLVKIQDLTADNPVQQSRLPELREHIAARINILDEAVKTRRAGGAGQPAPTGNRGLVEMDAVRSIIASMEKTEQDLLDQRRARVDESYLVAVITDLLAGIVSVAAIIGFIFLLGRYLRKRNEVTLTIAEQAERLRTTLASIGDAVITTDLDGKITNMNTVAESLTAWQTSDAIGVPLESVFRIVNENSRSPVESPVTKCLREGSIVDLANHTVLIAKDGTEFPIDDSAAPIRCKDGEIVGCVLVFRDVTERRRSEERMREAQSRLQSTLAFGEIGTWEFDVVNNIVFADRNLAQLFRLNENDASGGPLEAYLKFVHPDDVGTVKSDIEAVIENGENYEAQYRIVSVDDSIRWVMARGRVERDEHGRATRLPGVVVDITRTKLDEAAIAELISKLDRERRLFDSALSNTADFVYSFDLTGRFTYVNKALLDLWQRSPDEAFGKNFFELDYPAELAERLDQQIQQVIFTRQPVRDETPYTAHSGERQYEYIFVPVFGSNDDVEAVAGSTRDITERKQTELQLRLLAASLSEADRRKNEFLAMLAHELRNPLAPIRNGLEIIRMTGGDVREINVASKMMDRQVSQLVRLVDDLLDVSRITTGKIELRKQTIDLCSVVATAIEVAEPECEKGGVTIASDLPSDPIYLNGDAARLTQAVGNILNNACKFTDRNGMIEVTLTSDGKQARLAIRDTGIGIAPDQLDHIFELFAQADTSLERSSSGLGIGLSLVKSLVEMHGGQISADSDGLGRGSQFVLSLPLLPSGEIEESEKRSDEQLPVTAKKRRILVVDDNRDSAESLSILLGIAGHEAVIANDGIEAVEKASTFRPEVILLDIGLPKLNGYEAAREIRSQLWGQGVTLIALTGWGQSEDRARSKDAGFDVHMVKPVDYVRLMQFLEELD